MHGRSEPGAAELAARVPVLVAAVTQGSPTLAHVGTGAPWPGAPPTSKSLTCHTNLVRTEVSGPPSAVSRISGSSSAVMRRSHTSRYTEYTAFLVAPSVARV